MTAGLILRTGIAALLCAAFSISACSVEEAATRSPAQASLLAWWRARGQPPVDYVVSKFEGADWVFLGEYHRVRADVQLVADLIPALHGRTRVRHLAAEFLCRTRTNAANELITAPTYERSAVIDFLREQAPSWAYEEYLALFRAASESNQVFAEDRGAFQFVGLHPCIDWEVVNYGADPKAVERELGKRDRYDEIMASELEENLLTPGHPALVFTGIAHSTAKFVEYRYGTDEQLVRMGNIVFRDPWADRMFFIALHAPFWDAGAGADIYPFDGILDRLMLAYRAPVGFDVVESPFAGLTHQRRTERSITAYEFGQLYDGYIMHAAPLKQTVGVTCISDWIETPEELRHFWRNLPNKEASERFSRVPLAEFRRDFCAPNADHGLLFRNRFRKLPDLALLQQEREWDRAAAEIIRLSPSAFPELPPEVAAAAEQAGCTIPQAWGETGPHNVISGMFAAPGQTDWAVLCSRDGASSVMIIWGGRVTCPSPIRRALPDRSFLQVIEPDGILFSRGIARVRPDPRFWTFPAGFDPDSLTHDAVSDAFYEKGTAAYYCREGEWIELGSNG